MNHTILLLLAAMVLAGCGQRAANTAAATDSATHSPTTGVTPSAAGTPTTQNEGLAGTYNFYHTNGNPITATIQLAISNSGTDGSMTVQSGPMNCAVDFRLAQAANGYTMTCTGGESLGSCIEPEPSIGTVLGTLQVEPSGKLTIDFKNRTWNDNVFGGANPPSFIFQMPEE